MTHFPPIAAIASGTGVSSAVTLIRLTGEGCHTVLAPLLGLSRKDLDRWPARYLKLAPIIDTSSKEIIDEPLVVLFRAPYSFTGEESAEIHAHGGSYIVNRILVLLFEAGFRPAEPGEFTRRAFLHGKIDLTEAEGIRELIEAQTHQQWLAARHLATGKLKENIENLRRKLLETLAYLEAQIDFPDEGDIAHLVLRDVEKRAQTVYQDLLSLLKTYESGKIASQGLAVTLFGCPNAGKSTLLNELLGRQRAIVTDVAGTTRDYIEERCLVNGRLIRLFDLAGIRENPDPIEAYGIEAAMRLAKEADLVVFLVSADQEADQLFAVDHWKKSLEIQNHITLLTKSDVGIPAWANHLASISCKTGEGLDNLKSFLEKKVDGFLGSASKEASFITSARHAAALQEALKRLDSFFEAFEKNDYIECLAFEIHAAVNALAGIIGRIDSDEVLDQIFSQFCIGK